MCCIRTTDTPSIGAVVTPDRFGESADGSSLYPSEASCLRLYSSSIFSMLKIVIYFCFFYRAFLLVFFTSKNISRIAKISYNRNPVNFTKFPTN
jgi:hypothetical protein